jgi:hypothetical protein
MFWKKGLPLGSGPNKRRNAGAIPHANCTAAESSQEPAHGQVGCSGTKDRRSTMLRGGLLWLIGIPLPIILILFFLGYLS